MCTINKNLTVVNIVFIMSQPHIIPQLNYIILELMFNWH